MKRLFRSKRVKKTFAGAMSAVMAATIFMPMVKNIGSDDKLSDIVRADDTEPAMIQDSVSAVNYSTILGRGVDFGIVADYFQQRMHMQSTFAVGTYSRDRPCYRLQRVRRSRPFGLRRPMRAGQWYCLQ